MLVMLLMAGATITAKTETEGDKGELVMTEMMRRALDSENFPNQDWSAELNQKLNDFKRETEETLGKRYGRAFQVTSMKASPGAEEVLLFIRAEGDEPLMFTARVTGGSTIREDYVARLRMQECEKALEEALTRVGCEALVNATLPGCDSSALPADTSLAELLEREDVYGLLIRIALKAPVENGRGVEEALEAAGLRWGKWTVFSGYVLDEAGFEACREPFATLPEVTEAIVTDLDPVAEFSVSVRDGTCQAADVKGNVLTGGTDDGR